MAIDYSTVARVGVDLGQSVMQVHAVDATGGIVVAKQLRRDAFLPWCANLPSGCIVAMEACCAADHWARQLKLAGLAPKLISPHFVTPYRMEGKTGKNDANDAAAICEAAGRPRMRFVPVKTPAQQGLLALHSLREGYVRDRCACMNRVRGVLAEFGIVIPLTTKKFRTQVLDLLATRDCDLTPLARNVLRKCFRHFQELDRHITWCNKQIEKHAATDANAKLARSVRGVGVLSASALAASVGDLTQFKNGRQFSAWLGLVPSMASSGGVQRLGAITRRGDGYLRKLFVLGARSAMRVAPGQDDAVSRWAVQLRARVGGPKATVALANKNARILWSVLARSAKASVDPHD